MDKIFIATRTKISEKFYPRIKIFIPRSKFFSQDKILRNFPENFCQSQLCGIGQISFGQDENILLRTKILRMSLDMLFEKFYPRIIFSGIKILVIGPRSSESRSHDEDIMSHFATSRDRPNYHPHQSPSLCTDSYMSHKG